MSLHALQPEPQSMVWCGLAWSTEWWYKTGDKDQEETLPIGNIQCKPTVNNLFIKSLMTLNKGKCVSQHVKAVGKKKKKVHTDRSCWRKATDERRESLAHVLNKRWSNKYEEHIQVSFNRTALQTASALQPSGCKGQGGYRVQHEQFLWQG